MDPNLIGNALLPGLDVIGAGERLKRRRNLIYGGILAGILILGAGGYALWRRSKSKGKAQSESRKANRARRSAKRSRRRKNKRLTAAVKTKSPKAAPSAFYKTAPRTSIQTLIMSKDRFTTPKDAKAWANKEGFVSSKVDEKENTYRLRQHAPGLFGPKTFRTIELTDGVKAVIGKRKRYVKEKDVA